MVVVGGIGEVVAHVCLVLSIGEVVDPARRVGIYINNIGIQEVPRSCMLTVDGLTDNLAFVIDIGRVF